MVAVELGISFNLKGQRLLYPIREFICPKILILRQKTFMTQSFIEKGAL